MFDWLYDWKFWVVLALVIFFILWLFFGNWGWRRHEPYHYYEGNEKGRGSPRGEDRDDLEAGEGRAPRYRRAEARQEAEEGTPIDYQPPSPPRPPPPPPPRRYAVPVPIVPGRRYPLTSSREAVMPYNPDRSIELIEFEPQLPPHILRPLVDQHKSPDSAGERECRASAKRIYGVDFIKASPEWLRNPATGRKMELDLYNEELEIAIEYHGAPHYKDTPHFHRTKDAFLKQAERDNVKVDLCDQHGVYLITIPYTCPFDKIEDAIRWWDPTTRALREARLEAIGKM